MVFLLQGLKFVESINTSPNHKALCSISMNKNNLIMCTISDMGPNFIFWKTI